VSAETEYLRDQILSADKELISIRENHPWAGGLIVCQLRDHADQIASLVRELTGDQPIVVHGDIEGAKEQLRSYQNDTSSHRSRWLVTVQMVTEGVDIKHLRVLVYATSKTAPLFWTQVLGRILRYEPDAPIEQTAVFYQYADDRLVDYALRIEEAVETLRKVKEDTGGREGGSGGGTGAKRETEVISAEGQSDTRIYAGEAFNEDEIKVVEDAARRLGMQTTKLYAQLKAAGGVEFYERLYKAMSEQDSDINKEG
jgi:superfamily II DNA or RNA helicase